MTEPERRRVMRLDILRQPRGGEPEPHVAHLLDLSLLGVRIAHRDQWRKGVVWAVELPPAASHAIRTINASGGTL